MQYVKNIPFVLVVPGEFFLLEGVGVLSLEFPAEWTVDNEELRPSMKICKKFQ